jgi:hypothetical protein
MSIRIDMVPVEDAAEAERLCIHHLQLAAMYFEATDNDLEERLPRNEFSSPAMVDWARRMEALYPVEDDD